MLDEKQRELAEAVRHGCIAAARAAYEQAGISGLCGEGQWKLALEALRRRDPDELIALGRHGPMR